jgi:dihydroorotate dehydrogenase (fumarate)
MSIDLTTRYLGLNLRSPVVPSASPMGQRIETLKRMADAGAGAVVLPSLFEEQIEHDDMQLHGVLDLVAESNPEALSYLPEFDDYNTGADTYLRHLEATKHELDVPVIASLNGISAGGWIAHAKRMQQAGADALELNVYFIAADPELTGDEVEDRYVKLVEAVRAEISIPLAVKIGPFFSSVGHMAHRLVAAGADGLVLFNRFMQPDIDLETLRVDPALHLSSSEELRLPLRWIAILRERVHGSLALTTGVHTAQDALKGLLVGADVVMMASALLHEGPEHVATVVAGVETWMAEHGYDSVGQLRGSMSMANVPNPVAFARANYARLVTSFVSPYDWRGAEVQGELRA